MCSLKKMDRKQSAHDNELGIDTDASFVNADFVQACHPCLAQKRASYSRTLYAVIDAMIRWGETHKYKIRKPGKAILALIFYPSFEVE
jgi:hypothetical protein